jgi:uncharacterized protein with LGFP repeats
MSAISDKYNALGGNGGFLGSPKGAESPTPDGIGRFRHYQFGSIYWRLVGVERVVAHDLRSFRQLLSRRKASFMFMPMP